MSVIQMTPCIVSPNWASFVEWCARAFDMPVACRFDDQGWGRLSTASEGITVINEKHFQDSAKGQDTIVELEVTTMKKYLARALEAGAELITDAHEVAPGSTHAAIRSPQGILLWLYQNKGANKNDEINQGPIKFTVERTVEAPIKDVFNAATRKEVLEKTFVANCSEDMKEGGSVTWSWDEHTKGDLHMIEFRPNEFVAFHWNTSANYHTRTQFAFMPDGANKTRIAITESGWDADSRGLQSAFSHCEGWTTFASNLQLFLERDIASVGG